MQGNEPLVSIIIPAYNMADYTVRCVNSLLRQTYKNIEVIVVDDGSRDNTRAKMEEFGGKIKYIYKENGGACSARNRGVKEAKGKYIGFLDCDDMYYPQKVELSVRFLENYLEYGFVFSNVAYIDENDIAIRNHFSWNKRPYHGWIKKKLAVANFIGNPSVIMRRFCLDEIGLYREDIFPPADWDMWLRLSEKFQAGYIDKVLCAYRVVSLGCFRNIERSNKEALIVLDSFFQRNKDAGFITRRMAYAEHHLGIAECYFVKEDHENMRKEFGIALRMNPFSIKALGILFLYLFFRGYLRKILSGLIEFK
ncbi:MAG: glycosyltransferase [Candidatus Omnitrophica bacterium]|nr:glycosyltransferase [Candidatus Omnitrophota bacterium]